MKHRSFENASLKAPGAWCFGFCWNSTTEVTRRRTKRNDEMNDTTLNLPEAYSVILYTRIAMICSVAGREDAEKGKPLSIS